MIIFAYFLVTVSYFIKLYSKRIGVLRFSIPLRCVTHDNNNSIELQSVNIYLIFIKYLDQWYCIN